MSKKPKSKKKQKERAKKQQKWRREDERIKRLRVQAPYFKKLLQKRGCALPFYDGLDSFSDEFNRVVSEARQEYPSLVGVHEIDEETYLSTDRDWSKFECGDLQQIRFEFGDRAPDYGHERGNANLCGSMSAFRVSEGSLRSIILIRKRVVDTTLHPEHKYGFKVAALLHEIGHVHDLEQGINFDVANGRVDIIEAEVFANLFALQKLAERNLRLSYNLLKSGLEDAIPKGGYLAEVAQTVLERVPAHDLKDWQPFMDADPTAEELQMLGPKGIAALTASV